MSGNELIIITNEQEEIQQERRANLANYFLVLVREGSASEIKSFYSYFSSDVILLFEENIAKDNKDNPLRAAFIRGDPKIFNQIINLNLKLLAKNQTNDVGYTEVNLFAIGH